MLAAMCLLRVVGLVLLALPLTSCQSSIPEAQADPAPSVPIPAKSAVAVVELFTSEGCSSCPPADAILADLSASRGVYALSFHVDYWDDLGWPDRFASAENTARQRAYARSFGARGLYTPQMIVGGREPFVGSDREHANTAISRELAVAPVVFLALHARRTADGSVAIDYTAPEAPRGSLLNVAVVERAVSTAVRGGENAGKTLKHVNVVRTFTVAPLASPVGSTVVPVPPALRPQDAEIIAYAQGESTEGGAAPVLGAASAPIP